MPSETVRIRVSTLPFPEPGATFLSRLAYPHATNSSEANEFWFAICQRAILARSESDRDWGRTPQPVRPLFFMSSEIDGEAIRSGETLLERRFIAASIVTPMIIERLAGRLPPKAKDLRRRAMRSMNWKTGSSTTFSSRIWSQSRPVVHVAVGYLLAIMEPVLIWPPRVDVFFKFLASPELLRRAVIFSEAIRQEMPLLRGLRTKEEDTVRFLPD
jgi:hypothetical protein